jgi:phosphomannomutase
VGEANVVAKMQEAGAVFGGEGNGGVIDPRIGYVRDPFIGAALVLSLLVETGKKLSELVAELPRYTIVKDKFTAGPSQLADLYGQMQTHWPDAKANRDDGLRLDWHDRWVHVRPSNTEPIVRVIAEAPEPEAAQRLCREVGTMLAEAQVQKPKSAGRPAKAKRKEAGRGKAKVVSRRPKSRRK